MSKGTIGFVILTLILQIRNIYSRWPSYNNNYCKRSLTTISGTLAPKLGWVCSEELIFEDNFNKLDFKKWKHAITLSGGGNWEFQWYVNNRTNSFTKNGRLYIRPTLTSDRIGEEGLYERLDINGFHPGDECTEPNFYGCVRDGNRREGRIVNPVRSAKLTTVNSFAFKYGRVKIRAKFPTGDWLWPALYMIPLNDVYGTWPASGTMVLAEARGNEKLIYTHENGTRENIGINQMESKLRWGPTPTYDGWLKTNFVSHSERRNGFHEKFHVYEMLWTPEFIKFYIDDKLVGSVEPKKPFWDYGNFEAYNLENPWKYGTDMAPFDDEFYLIINLAVGGIFKFPDEAENYPPKPWSNKGEKAMTEFWEKRNDWLKTWKYPEYHGKSAAFIIDYVRIYAL